MLLVPALLEGDLVRVGSYPAQAWLAAAYLGAAAADEDGTCEAGSTFTLTSRSLMVLREYREPEVEPDLEAITGLFKKRAERGERGGDAKGNGHGNFEVACVGM